MWNFLTGSKRTRRYLLVMVAGGSLFAGPCGITSLQLQDFVRSSLIRTVSTTFFAAVESAVIEAGQQPGAVQP